MISVSVAVKRKISATASVRGKVSVSANVQAPTIIILDADMLIENDIPTGIKDGINTTFTLTYDFVSGTPMGYLNGQRLHGSGNDYTESAPKTILFTSPPQPTDKILFDYVKN